LEFGENNLKRLAIITTHPIQYNAPVFARLTAGRNAHIKVFYTWGESVLKDKYDPGFGKNIEWDIPLLNGYESTFVKNIAADPGSHHFKGIDNPTLINDVEKWKADAILVYGWAFKSHLKAIRYFHGRIPLFFRGDSTLLNEIGGVSLKRMSRYLFLKWVYRHVDMAFYVGSANKAYYKKFGLTEKQLVFAPHAIDNQRFKLKPGQDFRDQFGILPGEVVFLYAAKFEPVKNPRVLMQAFLNTGLTGAHLVMVGNGELEGMLKDMARNHKNEHTVHFINFQNQSQMPAVYQSADVFVLPSQSETWGLGVNEAMAAGLAVLVSNRCGCAVDLVENGVNGFIFESGNIEDLSGRLKEMAGDKNLLSEMGTQSELKIRNWSFNQAVDAVEKVMTAFEKV
jgi:glycosyltransferase involved in cell wall biosynthesis